MGQSGHMSTCKGARHIETRESCSCPQPCFSLNSYHSRSELHDVGRSLSAVPGHRAGMAPLCDTVMWAAIVDVARIGVEGFETEPSQAGDEWQREFQAQFPGRRLRWPRTLPRNTRSQMGKRRVASQGAHGCRSLSVSRLAWRPCKCV
jgi:hypothetical protein